jgi:hypothetical protein
MVQEIEIQPIRPLPEHRPLFQRLRDCILSQEASPAILGLEAMWQQIVVFVELLY